MTQKKILSKENGKGHWTEVTLSGEPKKKFLMSYSALERYFDKKELSISEYLNVLKVKEYQGHYDNGTTIYYDKLWRELRNPTGATYFGKVTKIVDTLFTVAVMDSLDNTLYNLSYSSLSPYKKHGKMSVFNDGQVVMERFYEDREIKSVKKFQDGKLAFEMAYQSSEAKNKEEDGKHILSLGEETITSGKAETKKYRVLAKEMEYHIEDQRLKHVKLDMDTIGLKHYYIPPTKKPLDVNDIKVALHEFLFVEHSVQNYALRPEMEGMAFIEVMTDYKGRAISYKLKTDIAKEMVPYLEEFCEKHFTKEGASTMRFKQLKLENKDDISSFFVPIAFENRRLFRTFSRPNHFWNDNFFWQQHWHLQQLHFQNQFTPPPVPNFSRF